MRALRALTRAASRDLFLRKMASPALLNKRGAPVVCRLTTYRHRFARAAPAPRAKRNSKNRGRASPVNPVVRLSCLKKCEKQDAAKIFNPKFPKHECRAYFISKKANFGQKWRLSSH